MWRLQVPKHKESRICARDVNTKCVNNKYVVDQRRTLTFQQDRVIFAKLEDTTNSQRVFGVLMLLLQ